MNLDDMHNYFISRSYLRVAFVFHILLNKYEDEFIKYKHKLTISFVTKSFAFELYVFYFNKKYKDQFKKTNMN